jgi:hypothetical protein
MTEDTRRGLRCGYMERSEWTEPLRLPKPFAVGPCAGKFALGTIDDPICLELPVREDDPDGPTDVPCCPGYLVGLTAVKEAGLAAMALKHGELPTYFPDSENAVLDAAAAMLASWNAFEAAQSKKAARESSNGGSSP